VLWKFEKGKRSSVKWIRNMPTAGRQWHDLKVRILGRIGLWSKADSNVYFDDLTIAPAK